jgi:hypothetical protein
MIIVAMLLVGVYGAEAINEKIREDAYMPIVKNYIFGTLLLGWSVKINYRVNEDMIANMQA